MQLFGLLTLVVIVLALPLYWLFEPSRQAGAREQGWPSWPGGAALFAPDRGPAASTVRAATAA